MPQTLARAALPTLEPDELAWLATQPDVESRIVFTERSGSGIAYRLELGPFEEEYLSGLPDNDWTLLVQDVDKHLPDFSAWFEQVSFIPKWRIDDLMVSFAAPGGSVGPHKDNYDVFLCQGAGTRHWRISEDGSVPPDDNATDLALLLPFEETATYECTRGDILYLPPDIPHWGIATDRCTTYSIGMRAPNKSELAVCASRVLSQGPVDSPVEANTGNNEFYTDRDLRQDESAGTRISLRSIERLFEQGLIERTLGTYQAAIIFGSQVTDPKAWLDPDKPSNGEIRRAMTGIETLSLHGMAQLAWFQENEIGLAFVNGEARDSSRVCTRFFHKLCDDGNLQPAQIQELNAATSGSAFLGWLLENGAFDLGAINE